LKKKRINTYDNLVEKLASASNPEQLANIYSDEDAKNLFEFYLKKHSEVLIYKQLYVSTFFPAVNKVIALDQKAHRNSKYKKLLTLSEDDFKENLYEVIRLAYVGLFHKYENFIDSLINYTLQLYKDDYKDRKEFEKVIQDKLDYRIKDWKNFGTISRLNWIVNCIKHYDSYPLKRNEKEINKGVPIEYLSYPTNKKIRLSTKDFKEDVDKVLKIFEFMFSFIPKVGPIKDLFKNDEDYVNLMGKEYVEESHRKAETICSNLKITLQTLKLL